MTKWIFLFITFITLATLTNAGNPDPVIEFLKKNGLSYPAQFELVFSCNHQSHTCLLISSDKKVRELKGQSAQDAMDLIKSLGLDPQAAYAGCENKSCRLGHIPDAVI